MTHLNNDEVWCVKLWCENATVPELVRALHSIKQMEVKYTTLKNKDKLTMIADMKMLLHARMVRGQNTQRTNT